MSDTATDEGSSCNPAEVFLDAAVRQRVEQALLALLQALRYAEDVQRSPWEFAVDLPQMRELGLTLNDLRWLVCKGFVASSPSGSPETKRLAPSNGGGEVLSFPRDTRFCITPAGVHQIGPRAALAPQRAAELAAASGQRSLPPQQAAAVPQWDSDLRELRFGGQLIRRFRSPSPNQEVVLTAFQEAGWPPFINDPLPFCAEPDRKQRLDDTIGRLNRHRMHRLLRFETDLSGLAVRWTS